MRLFFAAVFFALLTAQCFSRVEAAPHMLRVQLAGDSVIVDGTFRVGADDGRGALDSVRVDLTGLPSAGTRVWRAPLAFGTTLTYQFRVPAPIVGGSATYDVGADAWTFRRGLGTRTASNTVPLTFTDLAPPGGVHTLQAIIK